MAAQKAQHGRDGNDITDTVEQSPLVRDDPNAKVVQEFQEGCFTICELTQPGYRENAKTIVSQVLPQYQYPLHEKQLGNETETKAETPLSDQSEITNTCPVVFICGWASAPEEELQRYAHMYTTEFGIPTLRGSCSAFDIYLSRGGLENFAIEALRVLHVSVLLSILYPQELLVERTEIKHYTIHTLQEYFANRSLIFHVLSSGGFQIFNQIHKEWAKEEPAVPEALNVIGIIYDHCPYCYVTDSVAAALRESMPHWSLGAAFSWTTKSVLPYLWPQTHAYSEACKSKEQTIPQMYVYSDDDSQIDKRSLEDHIRQRGSRGTASVQSICFASDEHLCGLNNYSKQYKMAIHNFIVLCLSFLDRTNEDYFMPTQAMPMDIRSNTAFGNDIDNFGQGTVIPQDNHVTITNTADSISAV